MAECKRRCVREVVNTHVWAQGLSTGAILQEASSRSSILQSCLYRTVTYWECPPMCVCQPSGKAAVSLPFHSMFCAFFIHTLVLEMITMFWPLGWCWWGYDETDGYIRTNLTLPLGLSVDSPPYRGCFIVSQHLLGCWVNHGLSLYPLVNTACVFLFIVRHTLACRLSSLKLPNVSDCFNLSYPWLNPPCTGVLSSWKGEVPGSPPAYGPQWMSKCEEHFYSKSKVKVMFIVCCPLLSIGQYYWLMLSCWPIIDHVSHIIR